MFKRSPVVLWEYYEMEWLHRNDANEWRQLKEILKNKE